MKFLKYAATIPIALTLVSIVQAKSSHDFYTVPFYNVEIKDSSKIYVDYSFSSHSQTLVCTDNNSGAITSVEWSYKDATRKIELPVTLMDDEKFDGHYADPEGRLIITNDFGAFSNNGSIFVTCEYRNMN